MNPEQDQQFGRDVAEHPHSERRERARRDILEQIATGERLPRVLESIVAFVEQESPEARGSILLLDPQHRQLLHGAAPRLPEFYNQAVHGVEIGPTVGSCGTAAFTKQRVIVEDIETHPYWAPYRDLARRAGLRSCWSDPIVSSTGEVLGTFAIYHATPQGPTARELDAVALSTHLATIAIERARVEEAMRDSQRMLRMVMDNIPQGVFWKDRDSRYLGCNRVVARAFGFEGPEGIVGKYDCELAGLTREQAAFFVAKDRQVMQANAAEYGIIEPARLADGSSIWMETNKVPLHDDAGRVIGILGTWQDITERKRSEEQLRLSEERYRLVVERSLQGILIHQDGTIRYANDALARMFDYESASDLIGLPVWAAFVTPEHREELEDRTRRLLAGERVPPHPGWRAQGRTGRSIWVATSANRIEWQGRAAIVAFYLDVSERKHAEEALRQSEQKYRDLVETSHDLIWAVDTEGRWTFVNSHAARAIYGYEPEEMLGRPFAEFLTAEQARKDLEVFARIKAGHPVFHYETEHIRKDGTRVLLSFNAIPLHAADGRLLGTTGTATDITEHRRAEEERRKLDAQLQHTQKLESLGILAGGIAHDFNNLLTGILGYADLALLELSADSPARPLISQVMAGARRAAELTRQMLAYSGKGRFVVQPLNLSLLTQEMAHLLQVSISKKCVVRYNLAMDLPAIEADASQMRQVIMNLLINASEAVGEDSGVIAVSTGAKHCDRATLAESCLDEHLPEGAYVYLEVADTGCGMTEETRGKIFDPFFTTKFTGRGLGLSAVLGIVRGHRGAIKCASEPGKGTTITVLFPVTSLPAGFPPERDLGVTEWRGSGTVLLVDDEEVVRGLGRHMLEAMGFTVLTAADGREGVEVFRTHADRVRLVLLDMTMPRLDGWETFREMKRLRGDVQAILSSGFDEQTATSRFAGSGLAAFIQKPYRFEELSEVVRKVLGDGNALS